MASPTTEPTPPSPRHQLAAALRRFGDEPQPARVGWPHVFGSVLVFLLFVQGLTGFLLTLSYSPSTASAYESVRYIQERAVFGGLIRGMHRWAANLLVVVLVAHVTRVYFWGAYKHPRRWTWVSGCLLLLFVLGFGFTGYLLPWDLKAYFGTEVGTRIAGSTPVIGPYVLTWLRGGPHLGALTLPRFYAIHVLLLPSLLALGLGWHVWQVRTYGITAPWARVGGEQAVPTTGPFFPYQAARDNVAILVACALLFVLAVLESRGAFGPPLGVKADPSNASYVPRPDWYFLGLQQLLRIFPRGFGQVLATSVVPGLAVLLLVAVPFLDRNPERSPRRRPLALTAGALALVTVTALTVAGARAVRREEQALARRKGAGKAPAAPVARTAERPPRDEAESAEAGGRLFETLRCGSCHPVSGPPRDGIPTLAWEGSRARRSWLSIYLKHPTRIRWETRLAKQGQRPERRMPDFGLADDEVRQLTDFLMSKRDIRLIPDRPELSAPAEPAAVGRGETLAHETYRCVICHRIGKEGNPFGPDLTHVGSRRQPGFMYAIIENPYRLDHRTAMKNLHLGPDEIRDVVRYLGSLR